MADCPPLLQAPPRLVCVLRRCDSPGAPGQQTANVFRGQRAREQVAVVHHPTEQRRLTTGERGHLLLDRIPRDHPVDVHGASLTDAVGAIDRLRLGRRIPPWVQQEAVVGLGEVEAKAAGLQADQEQRIGFPRRSPPPRDRTLESRRQRQPRSARQLGPRTARGARRSQTDGRRTIPARASKRRSKLRISTIRCRRITATCSESRADRLRCE